MRIKNEKPQRQAMKNQVQVITFEEMRDNVSIKLILTHNDKDGNESACSYNCKLKRAFIQFFNCIFLNTFFIYTFKQKKRKIMKLSKVKKNH